ncbi:hypothetical protein [Flavobacterium salmonis]|uniref:Lipoprotein n=1 Tax=Flavobacterium salmonis TaxID=2654844 RepID=A0A6V6Z7P1_9FLAO|nr:hypothetical protein [Flavobacterium salmonis]CAD0007665.1 hypothetical protein FLAT13_03972 [Flavobacterium salmonis]
MKNLLCIVLLMLNTSLVSCQKIETKNEKESLKKVSDNSPKNSEKEKIFKQKKITCLGEKNSCTSCSNIEEDISILFNNDSFLFGINNRKYFYSLEGLLSEFGHQVYLFNNADENIIVIEEFYEEVDLHRFFYITNNEIYFIGEKTYGNEDRIHYINFEKKDNIINVKFPNTTTNKSNTLKFNLAFKKKLDDNLIEKTYTSELKGYWQTGCGNKFTELSVDNSDGYLSLNSVNAIYINLKVEKSSKEKEYILKYAGIGSQQNYYEDELKIKEGEISEDKIIGSMVIQKDGKALLNWIGLYNKKKKKLEFVGKDFSLIRESGGKNPVLLEKCD